MKFADSFIERFEAPVACPLILPSFGALNTRRVPDSLLLFPRDGVHRWDDTMVAIPGH